MISEKFIENYEMISDKFLENLWGTPEATIWYFK